MDERSMLLDQLPRRYRLTLQIKCDDLTLPSWRRVVPLDDVPARPRATHGRVERPGSAGSWGQDAPRLYCSADDPDGDFDGAVADVAVVEDAWQRWREEVAFAEQFVDATPDLSTTGTHRDGTVLQLRDILVHMIEEYARHCGHADLLRERIERRVGQ
jgi:hypothetical protein